MLEFWNKTENAGKGRVVERKTELEFQGRFIVRNEKKQVLNYREGEQREQKEKPVIVWRVGEKLRWKRAAEVKVYLET